MRQARDEEPAEPQAPVQDGAAPQPRKRRRATLNELTSQVFCFFTVTTLSFEPVSAGRRLRLWVQARKIEIPSSGRLSIRNPDSEIENAETRRNQTLHDNSVQSDPRSLAWIRLRIRNDIKISTISLSRDLIFDAVKRLLKKCVEKGYLRPTHENSQWQDSIRLS